MNVTTSGTAVSAPDNPGVTDADHAGGHAPQGSLAKLAVGAVGIVFGDIGTSPIYAFRETDQDWRAAAAEEAERLATQVWAVSGW